MFAEYHMAAVTQCIAILLRNMPKIFIRLLHIIPPPHGRLKFMGSNGCTVEPYLRPLCTLHTCEINGLGFKKNNWQWTEEYFALRERIELLMNELEIS